jgi:DNA polymerase III subunit delta'
VVEQQPATLNLRERVYGQDETFAKLDRALESGRLAHAYLFLGPRGTGKTRTALAFAQTLLSPGPDSPGYRRVARLAHPDLHLVFPMSKEDASDETKVGQIVAEYANSPYAMLATTETATIGIDQVRALKGSIAMARVEAPLRVIVWSDAGRLSEPAAQSTLKLVEEPPPDTVHILCAEDAAQILPTLVSRCQRIQIRLLPATVIASLLERDGAKPAEARILASLADGSLWRAAQMRREDMLGLRERSLRLFASAGASPSAVAQRVESVGRGWNPTLAQRAIGLLLMWYHDLLWMKHRLPHDGVVHLDRLSQLEAEAASISVEEIRRRAQILEEMAESVEQRVNPVLALQVALSRVASGSEAGDPVYF